MRFVEAEMAKQRVAQLRKIEKEKVIQEKKNDHEESVKIFINKIKYNSI